MSKQKVIQFRVSSLTRGNGKESVTLQTLPPEDLEEGQIFHAQSITYSNEEGEDAYKAFEDGEIVEVVVRKS